MINFDPRQQPHDVVLRNNQLPCSLMAFSKRRHIIILVLLTLLPFLTVRAEGFVTLDGFLSGRKTYQVTQDADGFIWIYTQNGIDRFDGHAVKTYRIEDLPQSRDEILSSTKLECDNSGSLWMVVKNGRLYRYDKPSDSSALRST